MRFIPGFDYLRFISVLAVVWIHGSDTNALALALQSYTVFAVPTFVMLSAFLMQYGLASHPERTFNSLVAHRFRRLVPAYLAWSAVYLAMRWVKAKWITGQQIDIDWLLVILGGGASYQLWFIPALLLWTVLFAPVGIWFAKQTPKPMAHLPLVLGGAALAVVGPILAGGFDVTEKYSLITKSPLALAGYYPLAMGIGLWYLRRQGGNRSGAPTLALRSTSGFVLAGTIILGRKLGLFYTPLFTVTLFSSGLLAPEGTNSKIIRSVSRNALGIYMIHALFVEGSQMLFPATGLDVSTFPVTASVIMASFALSAIVCEVLSRFDKTAWLTA